jgi:hypothetical protein
METEWQNLPPAYLPRPRPRPGRRRWRRRVRACGIQLSFPQPLNIINQDSTI